MSKPTVPAVNVSQGLRWLRWALAGAALVALGLVGGAAGLLRSEAATSWVVSKLPGVEVQGLRGAPFGTPFGFDRMTWHGDAGRLELLGLELGTLEWTWRPSRQVWIGIRAGGAELRSVQWTSAATPEAESVPPTMPLDLRAPVAVDLTLRVDQIRIDELAPIHDLALRLHAGADGGRKHAVENLSFQWDKLNVQAGLTLDSRAPFRLEGSAKLASNKGATLPWTADILAQGALDRIEIDATLAGAAIKGRQPASVTLKAAVAPFKTWPLAALNAQTSGLDLSSLSSQLPQTLLEGQAVVHSEALDRPLQAELTLKNTRPGRYDEGRLPLQAIDLALETVPASLDQVAIQRFDILFADAQAAAGRWTGKGHWAGTTLTLETRLTGLQPQRLDGRANALQVSGPVEVVLRNLPALAATGDPATPVAAPAPIEASLSAELEGRADVAPHQVQLGLSLTASPSRLQIDRFDARAGAARANLKATARQQRNGWQVDSEGGLVDFNPQPWWQGPAGSPWRRGTHRLNGQWKLSLWAPQTAPELEPLAALQQVTGTARVKVDQSMLAGVPISAQLEVSQDTGTKVQARLTAGGNQISLDGRALTTGDGTGDRWTIAIDAPKLVTLAPVAALFPASASWAPRQGKLTAQILASGRWPSMRSEGTADLDGLRTGPLGIDKGRARWQLATGTEAPLSADLQFDRLTWDKEQVPYLRTRLSGSWRAHELRTSIALPLQPPPALVKSMGLVAGKGTRVELHANGSWAQNPLGSRWEGRVKQLAAGVWDGRITSTPGPAPTDWLDARDLRAELELDPSAGLRRIRADAGRAQLAGGIKLRWEAIDYAPTAGQALLQLKAQIESFEVAPLLARWQPAQGWTGDLRVGANIDLRAGDRFDADIVIERVAGDLKVDDGTEVPLALGLTDLRMALNAHDGTWLLTQALAGRTVGELGGFLRIEAKPQDRWPGPDAPIDGSMLGRVGNLAIWGAWVPPGWRLAGSLQTSGAFAGTLGAPAFTGELKGEHIGVRNLLQGVHVTDGQVLVRLDGERATIETFTLRGGEGRLSLTGGATLGAEPAARLKLEADRFQVLGRIDRRLISSGRAELGLDAQSIDLRGDFKIDEGLFDATRADAPTLDSDVVVRRPGAPPPQEEAETSTQPRRKVQVALTLDLGDKLAVKGRGLDTRLAGQLKLTAPGGRLAVHGTVRTESGTYAAYGQKMEIKRGLVAFSGPVDSPRLDVLALRSKVDVEVGVAITGSAQTPRVRLHSNPEMSDTDKLSWLVLGKAPDALGRTDSALLQRAAIALLSGDEAGPTDTLVRNLGLDEISVRQSENGDVKDTVVSLGKQISDRWYVGYERGVNATTGTWQLIYKVAQRFTLRAQSGQENALDLIWVWRRP